MPSWMCYNRQTNEKKLLTEVEAFNLDKRLWEIWKWNVTDGHERPPHRYPVVTSIVRDIVPKVTICWQCGGIHFDSPVYCRRLEYVPYQLH